MGEHTALFERAASRYAEPELSIDTLLLRRDRTHRNQRVAAGVVGIAVFLLAAVGFVRLLGFEDTPANQPPEEPSISEVGGWIAFQDGGALRAIAPDGSAETVLFDERELEPWDWPQDWSPDGSRLLVTRYESRLFDSLSVIEPDRSETTLVRLDEATFFVGGASFSPDGATIVYTTAPKADDGPSQMWTIASDGSGAPRLVLESNERLHPGGSRSYPWLYEPTYSPDGTQIAYVDGWYDNRHSLRVVNADGTDVRVLFDETMPPFEGGHVRGVEWSPDGGLIAIAGGPEGDGSGIYTIRPDGTDLRLLIPEAASPAWSPDGSWIAYSPEDVTSEHGEGWGVWVANADGSNPRMISAIGQVGSWRPGAPADQA